MQLIKSILSFIANIFNVDKQRKELAEAYLSKAVDAADLEARQAYLQRMGYL